MTTAHSAAIKRSAQARPGLRLFVAAKSAASVEESCAATAKFRKRIFGKRIFPYAEKEFAVRFEVAGQLCVCERV